MQINRLYRSYAWSFAHLCGALWLAAAGAAAAGEATAGEATGDFVWAWSGGVGSTTAAIVGKATAPLALALAADDDWSKRQPVKGPNPILDADGIVRFMPDSLKPDTRYAWGAAAAAAAYGHFRTLPLPGKPASFQIVLASCAKFPDGPVFAAMAAHNPLFFLCLGDLHYGDIKTNDPAQFLAMISSRPAAHDWGLLSRACAMTYIWDDHDFGGNDSDWTAPSAPTAHASYRRLVPHHPLALSGNQAPIAQAFTVGRVRFLMPDMRSARNRIPNSILGNEQKTWIAAEIAAAPAQHKLLVLISSVPWNGSPMPGVDRWQAYSDERAWLAGLFKRAAIRTCVVAGDAHMVAIDDGSNSDFAPGWPTPVFQAASLHQGGSKKAGPYSHGYHTGSNQFGLMAVSDDGTTLTVKWEARDGIDGLGKAVVMGGTKREPKPIAYTFSVK